MLAEDHNIYAAEIVLTERGKPILASRYNQHLDFSITHDGPWVAVGITEHGRVGIDISEITNFQNWSEFAHQYLDLSEITHLCKLSPSEVPVEAARFWTLKEAILKATGHGLEVDPRSLILELAPHPIIRQLPAGLPAPDFFHLEEDARLTGSKLAVARLDDHIRLIAPTEIRGEFAVHYDGEVLALSPLPKISGEIAILLDALLIAERRPQTSPSIGQHPSLEPHRRSRPE